jgi:hypothetical protein
LVSNEGGRKVLHCTTLNKQVPQLKVGDLVAYRIVSVDPDPNNRSSFNHMGFVIAKLKPELHLTKGWAVDKDTSEN